MVTMEQLQAFMKRAAEEDAERKIVNVSGATLEDALREASIELGIPIKKIEYEVLERGSSGVLGVGRKPYLIVAYPARSDAVAEAVDDSLDMDFGFSTEKPRDEDGRALVRLAPEGVMFRVKPPVGNGSPLTERDAMHAIAKRTAEKVDTALVAKMVKLADDQWVRIADYDYNPANDAYVRTDIIEGEMKATITMTPPGEGGVDPTADSIRSVLETGGVIHGIDEERLAQIEADPRYREPIVVAEGTKPKNGADARVEYQFRANNREYHVHETKDGRVDFKELNRIENVVNGQVLARIVPPERGEPGQTVTGRMIPAKDGRDIDPPLGANTRLSDDGRSIVAEINGLVKLVSGKVTVEPVYLVQGDVNIKEGNIRFLGTVIVRGSVEDGFSVNAAGDVEIMGNVGKCVIEAEGDIIVHQGIAGKSEGNVHAGGSIWSKFIENAHVEAGDMVVVSDGIINSTVYADKRIVCRGRRASIVGGHIRAAEEVDAKTLGSVAGMETVVEVGYDPKSRERLLELEAKDRELEHTLEELALNMSTIENMRQQQRKISPDKLKAYASMRQQREKILKQRQKLVQDIRAIQSYLDELKTVGRISASGTVFPGVKIAIKDAQLPVRHETRAVTYVADDGVVKVTRYEESRADISVRKRGFEGVDTTD